MSSRVEAQVGAQEEVGVPVTRQLSLPYKHEAAYEADVGKIDFFPLSVGGLQWDSALEPQNERAHNSAHPPPLHPVESLPFDTH